MLPSLPSNTQSIPLLLNDIKQSVYEGYLGFLLTINFNRVDISLIKIKILEWPDLLFQLSILFYLKIKPAMKISSPFVEYIPDCKKNMRRLRKKIYKFITSKNYHRRQQNSTNDLISILAHRDVPQFITEQLNKRKNIDLSAIRNLSVPAHLTLREIAQITLAQEREVGVMQEEWLQNNRTRNKLRAYELDGLRERECLSKRTLSSTEFEYDDQEELQECSSDIFEQSEVEQNNLNQDIQFHHFARGNSFLQIESSILSQENLFKFQQ